MGSDHARSRASLPSNSCRCFGGHTVDINTEVIPVSLKNVSEISYFLLCEFANLTKGSHFTISSAKSSSTKKGGGGKENFPAGFLLQMKNESQHRSDKPHRPKQSTAQSPRLLLCPLRGTASLGDQLCSSESPCAWWPVAESAGLSLTAASSETFIFIPLF